MRHVIVVGGGAAGMMSAISAAESGCRVTLLEQNEKLGKKLFITGKGRCNVTNAGDAEDFFGHMITNGRFMYSSFYRFDNVQVMEMLTKAGLRLKTERGNRVFPESDKSSDVIRTFTRLLERYGVEVKLRTGVKSLLIMDGQCEGVVLKSGSSLKADGVILATGGLSYPSTGSTGDGHRMAVDSGHKLKESVPALVPLEVKEAEIGELQGLSLKNVSVTVGGGKKPLYTDFGEMLFTHFGVSGPCILSGSSKITRKLLTEELPLSIDLKPALTPEQLDERIRRDFEETPNRQFKNSLDRLLPGKLIPVIVLRSGIDPDKQVNKVTREERQKLVWVLKHLQWTLTGTRGFTEAIITQGGVAVSEINPSTMESKKIKHLYMAGELLDLDAVTGGYNLQIAWSTGYAAGKGASEDENCD